MTGEDLVNLQPLLLSVVNKLVVDIWKIVVFRIEGQTTDSNLVHLYPFDKDK